MWVTLRDQLTATTPCPLLTCSVSPKESLWMVCVMSGFCGWAVALCVDTWKFPGTWRERGRLHTSRWLSEGADGKGYLCMAWGNGVSCTGALGPWLVAFPTV